MKRKIIAGLLCLGMLASMQTVYATPNAVSQETSAAQSQTGRLYGIGSVSKVFTAAAVMKLAEQGRLDLDESLTAYIPDFTMADERYKQITARMLLNHSSGFMGSTQDNATLIGDNDAYAHDHMLEYLSTQTLKHDPGDRSIYSNDSFTLAEILVERVSGVSFTEFVEREFAEPMGLSSIKSPESEFDRETLAASYLGNSELGPENVNVIGSGGLYSTMDDLCRFSTLFMESADGSVLSKESVSEMAKIQHKMELIPPDADTITRYGLGWDSVELYPFNRLGIQAVGKGGSTGEYESYLLVLPEQNLAAAVASSGGSGQENLIAQEIILAVLEEEGLIPADTTFAMPEQNITRAPVPEEIKAYAGLYDGGMFFGIYDLAFMEDSMILTPIGVRNERPMEFIHNTDGMFVSENGDHFGLNALMSAASGAQGVTALTFAEGGKYLVAAQSYEDVPGLGMTAEAMPLAQRIEPASTSAQSEWDTRSGKEYLLVNEKYTSAAYMGGPLKVLTDERLPGYVLHGIYEAGVMGGKVFPATRIADGNTALGYQNTPTMMGRDIVNLTAEVKDSVEYLGVNHARYMDAAAATPLSELGDAVTVGAETVWVDVDAGNGGKALGIATPEDGAWFVYDNEMTCLATSLEKVPRDTVVLPEGGRLAFAGEAGAVFSLSA